MLVNQVRSPLTLSRPHPHHLAPSPSPLLHPHPHPHPEVRAKRQLASLSHPLTPSRSSPPSCTVRHPPTPFTLTLTHPHPHPPSPSPTLTLSPSPTSSDTHPHPHLFAPGAGKATTRRKGPHLTAGKLHGEEEAPLVVKTPCLTRADVVIKGKTRLRRSPEPMCCVKGWGNGRWEVAGVVIQLYIKGQGEYER